VEDVGREVARTAHTIDQPNLLYRALRWLSGWAVRWILGHVTYRGAVTVPARGPVLLVINHPNELCDILLTFGTTPRAIHFVGAIAHAASPVVGAALRAIGAIFVYRAHERGTTNNADQSNRDAMQQMIDVLRAGGVIAIFPEGGVRRDVPIGRLQPGAATLALRAVREGNVRDLSVVPIGISYRAPDTIRTDAVVTIGEPFHVDAWDRATHGEIAADASPRRVETAAMLTEIATRLGAASNASRVALTSQAQHPWPWWSLLLATPIALWGVLTHVVPFIVVRLLGRVTMKDPVERLGRLAIPGVIPMLGWYAMVVLAAAWLVQRGSGPLWLIAPLVLTLPRAAWVALRWADAWRARSLLT
jgi:1-acyl-sn-glycerol-3-phosphate acyltransferase